MKSDNAIPLAKSIPVPQNEQGTGNKASVKGGADADRDDTELADDYGIDAKAAADVDIDSSANAFLRQALKALLTNQLASAEDNAVKVYGNNTECVSSSTLVTNARDEEGFMCINTRYTQRFP